MLDIYTSSRVQQWFSSKHSDYESIINEKLRDSHSVNQEHICTHKCLLLSVVLDMFVMNLPHVYPMPMKSSFYI